MQQTDLFEASIQGNLKRNFPKTSFLERYRFSLRLDQALIGSIGMLVAFVMIFSLGVEKGKRFAFDELKAERSKHDRLVQEVKSRFFTDSPATQGAPIITSQIDEQGPKPLAVTAEVGGAPAPTAQETPEKAVESAVPANGKYTIQIVTYKSQKDADTQLQKLSSMGRQGFVIPSGKYLQVCVEAFESKQSAAQTLRQLKADGIVPPDAYVRPIAR